MTLTDRDISYVCELVHRNAAIVLDASKGYLVEARLASLTKRTGHASADDLVRQLRSTPWGELHGQVVEALTTNETSFFRDYHPWESLEATILPALIEARRAKRQLTIWCGACSSGQEPYTLGMIIKDRFPELDSWRVSIICTDISSRMVARTTEGRYSSMEINRGLDPQLRNRWFEQRDNAWYARAELRSLISARTFNLAEPWPTMPPVDMVLLRNVLIYFDVRTKAAILERLGRVLTPDGVLLLGAAETTINLTQAFTRAVSGSTSYYVRADPGETPSSVLNIGASA